MEEGKNASTIAAIGSALLCGGLLICVPTCVLADMVVSEVMYDVPSDLGGDDTHEWIEVMNTGSEDVDLTGWKVNDGSNHVLNAPPKNGGTGSLIVPAGGYVIIADDAAVFAQMYAVGVSVIDSSLSLNNAGDTVALVDREGTQVSAVTYEKSAGAAGDGNSLQLMGTYVAAIPTPGKANRSDAYVEETKSKKQNTETKKTTTKKTTGETETNAESGQDAVRGLTVEAGDDRAVIVGVPVPFVAVGVMSAVYEWNFGDGTTGSGAQTTHVYAHSGRYTAVVSMSVNGQTVTDEVVVTVSGADVSLRTVPSGVEIKNNGRSDLDISRWILVAGGGQFSIRENTRIAAGSSIVLTDSTVGLSLGEDTRLTLPDGKEMARVESAVSALTRTALAKTIPRVSSDAVSEASEIVTTQDGASESVSPDTANVFARAHNDHVKLPDDISGSSSQVAAIAESETTASFPLWGAGIAGVLALGIVGVVALRTPAQGEKDVVEEYEDESVDATSCIHVADGDTVTADDFEIIEIPGEHQLV